MVVKFVFLSFVLLLSLLSIFIFISGCVKTEYVCGDGTIVNKPEECKPVVQIIERNVTVEKTFFVCPDGAIVRNSSECAPIYVCLDGRTVKNATECPKCISDGDCNFWEECRNGSCRVKSGMCATQEDCALGFLCAQHKCVQAPFLCKGDVDCEEDEVCSAGVCQKKITRCTYDWQCGDFEECAGGVCRLMPGYCRTQIDCGFLYACASGRCVEDCTLVNIGQFYSTKITDVPAIRDAAASAISELKASDFQEARAYKEQLDANLRAGVISPIEHANVLNAIAAYIYVRDKINYALGPPGGAIQSDRVTLRRAIGKCDEKAILLVSMLRAVGINATLGLTSTKNETCKTADCGCLSKMDHAYVEIYLPEFKKLQVFEEKIHFANMSYCARGDWIAVDPTCSGCAFAYGGECGPFQIPVETLKR